MLGLELVLMSAALTKDLEKTKKLIELGADIHFWGDYVLRLACTFGYTEVVKLLLLYGADVNAQDGTPLKNAVSNNHKEIIKLLVENGADAGILIA